MEVIYTSALYEANLYFGDLRRKNRDKVKGLDALKDVQLGRFKSQTSQRDVRSCVVLDS